MGTAIPRIPGVEDHITYLAFLADRERYDKYHADLVAQMERLTGLIETYGKAKEIDQLHADAADLKASVLAEIEKRETDLKSDREALTEDAAKLKQAFAEEQRVAGERVQAKEQAAAEALKAAEAHEAAAQEANKQAQAAREAAEEDRARVAELKADLEQRAANARKVIEAVA